MVIEENKKKKYKNKLNLKKKKSHYSVRSLKTINFSLQNQAKKLYKNRFNKKS